MVDAFDHNALWNKSKVYIDKACVARDQNDEWTFHLWAALALELLGKAALATVHPALVADPSDPRSLLAACGVQVTHRMKSVTAKTVFERLVLAVQVFDTAMADQCMKMMNRRNAELHSGESPITGLLQKAWVPVFWKNAAVLISAQGRTLEEWVGPDEAGRANAIIQDSAETERQAVLGRIARRREEFENRCPSGSRAYDDAVRRAESRSAPEASEDTAYEPVECPSCGLAAWLMGEEWHRDITEELVVDYDEDGPYGGYYDVVTITYGGESFECAECGLRLEGSREIEIASLPREFRDQSEEEPDYEPEYGNE